MAHLCYDKPKGGYRAILLQAAFMRLWEKLRKPSIRGYCKKIKQDVWSMGSGVSIEDVIFVKAAVAEHAKSLDLHTGKQLCGGPKT